MQYAGKRVVRGRETTVWLPKILRPPPKVCRCCQILCGMEAEQQEQEQNNALVQFLLELVLGQWNAVPGSGTVPGNDKGEGDQNIVGRVAHLLSDELRTLILHKALVHPRKGYQFIQHGLLLLNGDYRIKAMGVGTAGFFGLSENALYKSDFTHYLTAQSQKDFIEAGTLVEQESGVVPQLRELYFQREDTTCFKAHCFIGRILYKRDMLMVSLFGLKPIRVPSEKPKDSANPERLSAAQQVYDYIQGHREGSLPNAHEFARRFGTNEFELKKEFKAGFGTSIYQCYTRVRLDRARELLLAGDLPLLQIAQQCGFEDYSSFARAYKKQYGFPPGKIRE